MEDPKILKLEMEQAIRKILTKFEENNPDLELAGVSFSRDYATNAGRKTNKLKPLDRDYIEKVDLDIRIK